MRKSTTTNINRLEFLGYRNAYEVLKAIGDIAAREKMAARFNEIAYEVRINPSILIILLERGREAGLFTKQNKEGYLLTPVGVTILEHANAILEA